MKRYQLTIVMFLACCLLVSGQMLYPLSAPTPAFGVIASQGADQPSPHGIRLPNYTPTSWQSSSPVRRIGSSYLTQYLRRRGVEPAGGLQVNISGVSCELSESRGYGRVSYRVTYSMRMEARLNGQVIWQGMVHHRELNLTGRSHITEGIRLLLVKKGVNQLVGVLSRGADIP